MRRQRNPGKFAIVTRKGRGPLMHFDGRKFTNNGKPRTYTFAIASAKARYLLRRYSILTDKGYHVWLQPQARNNPESPGIEEAARKLEQFSGHPAKEVIRFQMSDQKEGLIIGELPELRYITKREGINSDRLTEWHHKFRKASRPLLAVTKDGNQLHIVGGRYEFTEAGIEDR